MGSRTRFNEGTREISFRYDILDKNNVKKGEASNIVDGKISFNAFANIHRTATFKLREEAPPPENIPIVAGNTYTTTSFPPLTWTSDGWTHNAYGEIRPETVYEGDALNPEMDGSLYTNGWGSLWDKWEVFKPTLLHNTAYTTGEKGCSSFAQTVKKMDVTGNYRAGILATDWVSTRMPPSDVYFGFMYKLFVGGSPSTAKPCVWAIPETANEGNNWAGAVKVADANITTRVMNNGWIFAEGIHGITVQPPPSLLSRWRFAFGYESANSFEIRLDSVYVSQSRERRMSNQCTSTCTAFDISYSKVVDGVIPTFKEARMYFDLVPATYRADEVAEPSNKVYYQTSIDGGTNWSVWTLASKGAAISTIPVGTNSANLKMRLKWEADRYSMGDAKARIRDFSIEVNYNAKGKNPLTDSIDYRVDRIRPYMIYKDGASTIERSLGIFLLNSPTRKDEGSRVYREVTAYDQLSILADAKVIYAFETKAEPFKPLTDLVKEILTGTDTTIPVKFGHAFNPAFVDITTGTIGTLARTMKFEVGQSWLNVINSLLTSINYTPIYATGDGVLTSRPYQLPENRPTSHTYIDDELSIIYKQAEEEYDIHDVPNVFVCTQQADSEGERLYSRLFNNNVGSLSSIPNVGRYIVDYREVDNIANQGTLDTYCARVASEASQTYGKVIFRTALMPSHEYMNNIQLRYQTLRVDDIYTETDWSMDLRVGGQMEHRVRKVVRI